MPPCKLVFISMPESRATIAPLSVMICSPEISPSGKTRFAMTPRLTPAMLCWVIALAPFIGLASLLAIRWQAGEDGTGRLSLDFAGDGTILADVECINLDLRDVTRPHRAVSGKAPRHPD